MLAITLRQVEVFTVVVECGGFAAAADRLGIAQASVSAHMLALEEQIAGNLFERRPGQRPILTPLGETFLKHAHRLLADTAELTADLQQRRQKDARRIVFACQRTVANYIVQPGLAQFVQDNSDTELIIHTGRQEDVVNEIKNGTADIGQFLSDKRGADLQSEVIGAARVVFVAAPTHPLAKRRGIPPAELSAHPFIGPPQSSLFGQAVTRLMTGAGIRNINVVAQATEYPPLRELVVAGIGISSSVLSSVEKDVERECMVILDVDVPPLFLDVRLAISQKRAPSPSLPTFVDFLRRTSRSDSPRSVIESHRETAA